MQIYLQIVRRQSSYTQVWGKERDEENNYYL